MSRVTKPCPGCKTTDHRRDGADEVCGRCKQLLKTAIELEKRREARASDGRVKVSTTTRDYALPNLYRHCADLETTECNALRKAFFALIEAATEETLGQGYGMLTMAELSVPPVEKNEVMEFGTLVTMPNRQAKAINDLWRAVCTALGGVSVSAFDRGRNMLLGVASGTTTVDDLNDASTKRKRS